MDKLVKLVKCLKPSEIQLVKDFYKLKSQNKSKRLWLFNNILSGKIKNNYQAAKELYNHKPDSALCHLKKKLEEDILNFILITPTIIEVSSDIRDEIKCRKLLLQGKILISRGMQDEGISLLKKTSRIAEKLELPDVELVSNDLLRELGAIMHLTKTHQNYQDRIDKTFDTFQSILNAKEMNYSLNLNSQGYVREPRISIPVLDQIGSTWQSCNSRKATFWFEMALLQKHFNDREFGTAKGCTIRLLEYLKKEPTLNVPTKKADLLLKLSKASIYLGNYQNAINPSERALSLIRENHNHYLFALQLLFFAYFRSGYLDMAEGICQKAIKVHQKDPQLLARWALQNAAIKFSNQNFTTTTKILHRIRLKSRDKVWGIGHNLLEMLTILEIIDYDWFEFKFESFRKKVTHLQWEGKERLKMICQLMRALIRSNYNYQKIIRCEYKTLELLGKKQTPFYWDPMGYELINFHDWLLVKANRN